MKGKSSQSSSKTVGKRQKGPLDRFVLPPPEKAVQIRKMKQTTMKDAYDKKARENTCQYIARFFYRTGLPFNVVKYEEFDCMVEAIGRYGPGLKPPSYHELRVPLLKYEVDHTNDIMKEHREAWKRYECTIMSDGWRDRANRDLVNILVNSPKASMFIETIDLSSVPKAAERLFVSLDKYVESVRETNVVQVITDNASNYVLAGKKTSL